LHASAWRGFVSASRAFFFIYILQHVSKLTTKVYCTRAGVIRLVAFLNVPVSRGSLLLRAGNIGVYRPLPTGSLEPSSWARIERSGLQSLSVYERARTSETYIAQTSATLHIAIYCSDRKYVLQAMENVTEPRGADKPFSTHRSSNSRPLGLDTCLRIDTAKERLTYG